MRAFIAIVVALVFSTQASEVKEKPRDLDTPRTFPEIHSKAEWQKRAGQIHDNVLVSCGLWPMPEKTPLNAHVFGRLERDGYSVEKVYLETYPGFFLGGNLYRPLGHGKGPFPGILNPHGHWDQGRLTDAESGSIPARCISFARQGMVAFAYDMAGYNDTKQVAHRAFATDPTNLLWSVSMMGLQTWDSIRALDFLASLPDVDKKRLACTGASGGGTQTFMLGAADDRLAAQAPIVMVSHIMQGGCLCENAPGLRVDYSNMEIAAQPAPRPQILVASTGDWTRATMTVEGPALQRIYDLFGASDHLRYAIFNFNHNYNQTTREAVYPWFGKWLLHDDNAADFKEQSHAKEPDTNMLAFADGKLPDGALTQEQLLASIIDRDKAQLEAARPHDRKSLAAWKKVWRTAWEHDFQLPAVKKVGESRAGNKITLTRDPDQVEVNLESIEPSEKKADLTVILAQAGAVQDSDRALAKQLASGGVRVLIVELPVEVMAANQFTNFFCTYNRTLMQKRVADLKAVIDFAKEHSPKTRVVLAGRGEAGLACLAAGPLAAGVVADCNRLDDSRDQPLLANDVFVPGLRRIGSFNGIAALAAPHPLLLHNTGGKLDVSWLDPLYSGKAQYRHSADLLADNEIADWVLKMAKR
jgi:dienelactone hydrolase